MLERKKIINVLIGVMTIAMIVAIVFLGRQKFGVDTPQPTEALTPTTEAVTVTVASTSIRSFKSKEELEAFLQSGDPAVRMLSTYMISPAFRIATSSI